MNSSYDLKSIAPEQSKESAMTIHNLVADNTKRQAVLCAAMRDAETAKGRVKAALSRLPSAERLSLLEYHGNYIVYVDNPTEAEQVAAVKIDHTNLDLIRNPCPAAIAESMQPNPVFADIYSGYTNDYY